MRRRRAFRVRTTGVALRFVVGGGCLALGACSTGSTILSKIDTSLGLRADPEAASEAAAPPPAEVEVAEAAPHQVVGRPYQMAGNWYHPEPDPDYDRTGEASWYGARFDGRRTANGEIFDPDGITAAHPTLPLPSYVRVTNLENDRSLIVRVNDRGPYRHNRLIDVSERAAEMLGFKRSGEAQVRVEYVDAADLNTDDERYLLASYRGPGRYPATDDASTIAVATFENDEPESSIQLASLEPAASAPQTQSVAFTEEAGAGGQRIIQAVESATTAYQPDDRILMAFDLLDETAN